MNAPPTGIVTFLMAEVDQSARLWRDFPQEIAAAMRRHDLLAQQSVEDHRGYIYRMQNGCRAAFADPGDAVNAAVDLQRRMIKEPWPEVLALRVRVALHTGQGIWAGGDYAGQAQKRGLKLLHLANGGQILLSSTVVSLIKKTLSDGIGLLDLGSHRFPDLPAPEQIFQLSHPNLPTEFPKLRLWAGPFHNLPLQLTRFVGRSSEISELCKRVSVARLVTLTGAGGCGKTRLAIETAARSIQNFPDGVWMVDFSTIRAARLVPQTVAAALGVHEEPHKPIVKTLAGSLQSKRVLLVLDNCEHLVEACGELIRSFLHTCLLLNILVTSRQPLGVPGEQVWRVPSLSLPDPGRKNSTARATADSDAVVLFVERTKQASPEFEPSGREMARIGEICRRLDGIPLAIELAAARAATLPLDEIAARLRDRFRFLSSSSASALPRHQTLRATLDWSYNSLTKKEKGLFRRLSVFSGGFDVEAAEIIGSGKEIKEADLSRHLSALVDKSLVAIEEGPEERPRYRLLETIKEYAHEKLQEGDEIFAVRNRHRDYYLAFAEEANKHMVGADQEIWLDRIDCEHDNLRSALEWCSRDPEGVDSQLRLAGALWWFWQIRGHLREGRQEIANALSRPEPPDAPFHRAMACYGGSSLAFEQGDYEEARRLVEESIAFFRSESDLKHTAMALNRLGEIALLQGDYETALQHYEESLSVFRHLNDPWNIANLTLNLGIVAERKLDYTRAEKLYNQAIPLYELAGDVRGTALALNNLGELSQIRGDYLLASERYERALAIFKKLGELRRTGAVLIGLGLASLAQGSQQKAASCFTESLQIARELGDNLVMSWGLDGFAFLALAAKQIERSATLLGAAGALRKRTGYSLSQPELRLRDRYLAQVGERLGSDPFRKMLSAGEAMHVEEAVSLALEEGPMSIQSLES